jgi:hypothetical protein
VQYKGAACSKDVITGEDRNIRGSWSSITRSTKDKIRGSYGWNEQGHTCRRNWSNRSWGGLHLGWKLIFIKNNMSSNKDFVSDRIQTSISLIVGTIA